MAFTKTTGELMMKKEHTMTIARRLTLSSVIAIATMLLAVLVGIAVIKSMPKAYAATVLIQIERERISLEAYGTPEDIQARKEHHQKFIREHMKVIPSTSIIEKVVRELNLHEILGREYGYYGEDASIGRTIWFVQKRLTGGLLKDTDLIAITITLDRPKGQAAQLAVDTANTVAKVFQTWVREEERQKRQEALDALKRNIEEQDLKIEALEKILESDKENDIVRPEIKTSKLRLDYLKEQYMVETLKLHLPSVSVRIVQPAKIEDSSIPVSPNLAFNVMWSAVVGLFLGSAMAVVFFIRS